MRSLRQKLIVAGLSLQFGVLALFLAGMNLALRASLADSFAAQAAQTAEIINLATAPSLSRGQHAEIQDFFDEMLRNSEGQLRYVVVQTPDGQRLTAAGQIPEGTLPAPSSGGKEALEHGMYHVRAPVLLENNAVGTLQFGIATTLLSTLLRQLFYIALGISLLVGTSAAVLSVFASRRIGLRLAKLTQANENLAAGNYATRLPADIPDELGELARHFNTMAEQIGDQIRRIGEARNRFQGVFDGSPVALAVVLRTDSDFLLIDANEAWERQFEQPRLSSCGKTLTDLGVFATPEDAATLRRLIEGEITPAQDVRMFNRSHHELRCAIDSRPLELANGVHHIVAMQDVSEQRRNAEALATLNSELEARVAARTMELAERNETLAQTLNQLKQTQDYLLQSEKLKSLGALVAGVAHELNTPLGNARMANSVIHDIHDTLASGIETSITRSAMKHILAQMEEATTLLDRNLERAGNLILTFKEITVDRSTAHRRHFELRPFLEEVTAAVGSAPDLGKGIIELDVASDITCNSYSGPLGQVLINVLENARHHGYADRSGGRIRLHAEQLPNDLIRLSVTDYGVGIAPEHLPHVFDPFFTTRLGQGNSGLGLSIAYNLVTGLLGGSLSIDSEPGRGTRVDIFFPRCAPEAPVFQIDQQDA